jgi:hypothetical protein
LVPTSFFGARLDGITRGTAMAISGAVPQSGHCPAETVWLATSRAR